MKIHISDHDGPYSCDVYTGVMDVEIRENFNGLRLITESGEILGVSMRDNGFEVNYFADYGDQGFTVPMVEFKDGVVRFARGVNDGSRHG